MIVVVDLMTAVGMFRYFAFCISRPTKIEPIVTPVIMRVNNMMPMLVSTMGLRQKEALSGRSGRYFGKGASSRSMFSKFWSPFWTLSECCGSDDAVEGCMMR
jgi:hypothetical protein